MRRTYFSMIGRLAGALLPSTIARVGTAEKVLYLTFDDGPTEKLTLRLLDLLDRYNAKATFFLQGNSVDRYPSNAHDIVARGHELGNHTYTHVDPWKASSAVLIDELDKTDALLQQVANRAVRLARPPYGHLTPTFVRWCQKHDTQMILWDVMPGDWWGESTSESVASFTRKLARPGSVVVLHDNDGKTVQRHTGAAVEEILEYFSDEGWHFRAVPANR